MEFPSFPAPHSSAGNSSTGNPPSMPSPPHPSQPWTDMVVSLATAPVLLALVGGRAIADLIHQAGLVSEELFRGDRLPVIPTPPETEVINTPEIADDLS